MVESFPFSENELNNINRRRVTLYIGGALSVHRERLFMKSFDNKLKHIILQYHSRMILLRKICIFTLGKEDAGTPYKTLNLRQMNIMGCICVFCNNIV